VGERGRHVAQLHPALRPPPQEHPSAIGESSMGPGALDFQDSLCDAHPFDPAIDICARVAFHSSLNRVRNRIFGRLCNHQPGRPPNLDIADDAHIGPIDCFADIALGVALSPSSRSRKRRCSRVSASVCCNVRSVRVASLASLSVVMSCSTRAHCCAMRFSISTICRRAAAVTSWFML
jgi:hypothetical protein